MERKDLAFWTDKDMRIEGARLLDSVQAVMVKGSMEYTPFLSVAMGNWLEGIIRRERLAFIKNSGFPTAERQRYLISDDSEKLQTLSSGINVLWVVPLNPKSELNHRQVLGSLLGLGLKREVIGDIQLGRTGYYVAVTEEIAPFILEEWDQVGREKVRVTLVTGEPEVVPDQGEQRFITVNSPRLDAVLASGFGLSRSTAQSIIALGHVKINDLVCLKADTAVHQGDLISCRGYGRLRLDEFPGTTRKGRQAIRAALYRSRKQ